MHILCYHILSFAQWTGSYTTECSLSPYRIMRMMDGNALGGPT